jgi:predicted DsbA family dithiol-disulfide isomerase
MAKLRVDIWSDIACPWCYIGKRRFEAALAQFPGRGEVEVAWRAFELDPAAPRLRDKNSSYAARLAKKYGVPVARAEAMLGHMTDVAAAEGLALEFERIQSGNTFDAHRLLHLARERGKQDALKERLLCAYFTEGEPIGEPEALVRLAAQAGLDADEVVATLASDALTREVRADEDQARRLGIHGVPFFVFGARYGVSGAQAPEVLLRVLEQAKEESTASVDFVDGAACGPEDCA